MRLKYSVLRPSSELASDLETGLKAGNWKLKLEVEGSYSNPSGESPFL
jgi:hypothetical protein